MISHSPKQRQALLKAINSICGVFWGPEDHFCESVEEGSFLAPFEELSLWLAYDPPDVLDRIKGVVDRHVNVTSFCSDLEEVYVRLFISNRGGIAAPLYQSCYEYENAPLMGSAAGEMKERFESKGLSLAGSMNEPPDHISIELEYLYFLLETGWAEENREFLEEAAIFAADNLIPWLTKLFGRLPEEGTGCFYYLCTSLLISILSHSFTERKAPLVNEG